MQHWHKKTDFSESSRPEPLAVRIGNAASAVEAKHPMSVARKPSRPPRTQEFNTSSCPADTNVSQGPQWSSRDTLAQWVSRR